MRRPALALLAAVGLASPAAGYTEPVLAGYTKETADKRFVFVVRPALGDPTGPGSDPVARKYPHSGLYRNDGSVTPLWTLPPGHDRDAYPASDGVHLVTTPVPVVTIHDGTNPADEVVLVFHANGMVIRTVKLGEVLDAAAFAQDRGPGWHVWLRSARLDDAAGTFTAETVAGTRRLFRLSDGQLVADAERLVATDGRDEPSLAEVCGTRDARPESPVLGYVLAGVAVLGAAGIAVVLLRSGGPRKPSVFRG